MKAGRAATASVAAASALLVAAPAHGRGTDRRFSHPIHVDRAVADRTAEPSIAVASDGTEYIVAPDGPGARTPTGIGSSGAGGSLLWRSTDRGRSWSFLGSYDVPTGGGDTDIAVMPSGTLVASGLSSVACSTVAVSTDRGTSWRDDPLAGCAQVPLQNDRQWTAVDGNSTIYTVVGDTLRGHIDLVRASISDGIALPSTTMELTTAGDYQWPGTVAVDRRDGTAYVGWNTTDDRIEVSVLGRGADNAPPPVTVARRVFDTYDSFVVVDVDKAGTVYAVWSERHPAQRQTWIMLARSLDRGRTWSTPARVGRSSQTAIFPWITAGDAGRIAVSFYGTTARAASANTVPATAEWQVFTSYSTDAGRHFTDYRITPTMHRGAICTSGLGCPGNTRNLLDFFETAVDTKGCLVAAYADDRIGGDGGGGGSAVVSYVRQTSGPGLSARFACR